jgi:hypothetical protein
VDGEPGRVITAVFELAQPLEQDRRRLSRPYVPNDSAHTRFPLFPGAGPEFSSRQISHRTVPSATFWTSSHQPRQKRPAAIRLANHDFSRFVAGSSLAAESRMATTAINRPMPLRGAQLINVIAVLTAIVAALTVLLGVTYLMYRNSPETGTDQIDQARGVTPQYPPATPAEPESQRGPIPE